MAEARDPADELIREIIHTRRRASESEVLLILRRIGGAPFDPRRLAVHPNEQDRTYQGVTLGTREPSLSTHLVRRVLTDSQWAAGTTAEEYLEDLHATISARSVRLVVYERRGGNIAAILAATDEVVPPARQGLRSLPELLVLYSADRAVIISGYQISSVAEAGIPGSAQWLT